MVGERLYALARVKETSLNSSFERTYHNLRAFDISTPRAPHVAGDTYAGVLAETVFTDGTRLYAAETHTGRVFWWSLSGPGEVERDNPVGNGGHLLAGLPGLQLLDSLAVDGDGWVCVGTLVNGGITAISPDGETIEHTPLPDPLVTNICFGGADLRTAYATLSGTGTLVAFDWPRQGHRLHLGVVAGFVAEQKPQPPGRHRLRGALGLRSADSNRHAGGCALPPRHHTARRADPAGRP